MVKVKLLRPWPVGDTTHQPGEVIDVPAARADRMERRSPPWAKRVDESAQPAKAKDGGS